VKALTDLIAEMQKVGECWHGDVAGATAGLGGSADLMIRSAKTTLDTMKKQIDKAKKG
jgi:hypothetical protein